MDKILARLKKDKCDDPDTGCPYTFDAKTNTLEVKSTGPCFGPYAFIPFGPKSGYKISDNKLFINVTLNEKLNLTTYEAAVKEDVENFEYITPKKGTYTIIKSKHFEAFQVYC